MLESISVIIYIVIVVIGITEKYILATEDVRRINGG
jgi:hypothetical protein